MHIVLGGTGRVGSATARALLKRGEPVTIVTRDAAHGADLGSRPLRPLLLLDLLAQRAGIGEGLGMGNAQADEYSGQEQPDE